jgi:hypothetical protein
VRAFVVFLCCLPIAFVATSCDGGSGSPSTTAIPSPVATSAATSIVAPTPPATPAIPPPTSGGSTATCQGGWTTPPEGSPLWTTPLQVIRRAARIASPLAVVEMRTFVGGESPPTEKNYLKVIRRWYVQAYDPKDLAFQGRFLVEERRFGKGLAAVAPYDTRGFTSPDWVGFQYDAANRQRYHYAGLPGTWSGDAYDFVNGGRGLTFPGLPANLVGCLDGT